MIIRRRGSDYADSEFDLWGGRGDAPLERGDPFSPTLFTEGFSFIASTIREDLWFIFLQGRMWRTYIRGQTIIRFFNVQWTFAFLCFFNYLLILSLVRGETMELSDSYTDLYSLSVERIHDSVILLASRCPKRFSYHVRMFYPSQGSSLNDSRFPPLSSLLSNKINSSMKRKNDVPLLDETANRFSFNKNFRSTIFLFIGHFTFSII